MRPTHKFVNAHGEEIWGRPVVGHWFLFLCNDKRTWCPEPTYATYPLERLTDEELLEAGIEPEGLFEAGRE